jgi:hypothetical protein
MARMLVITLDTQVIHRGILGWPRRGPQVAAGKRIKKMASPAVGSKVISVT